jgi:cytoskeletal protein RodZ
VKEIGEYLRQVRTEKNISLNDIQEATKIRKHYLEAIENGDFEAIPGEVYRKGFLVNYANAIGLDGQEILARYNKAKQPQGEIIPESRKEPEPKKGTVSRKEPEYKKTEVNQKEPEPFIESGFKTEPEMFKKKGRPRIRLKNTTNLVVFASIILVIVIAWIVIPVIKERTIKLNGAATEISTTKTVVPTPKPGQDNVPVATETPATTASPDTVTQILPAPVTVYAEFSSEVWVQVIQDGKPIYMENGQTFKMDSPKQLWTAQKELKIIIGTPGGIKLTLNGKDLGKIGDWGIRKTITLTPDGLASESEN